MDENQKKKGRAGASKAHPTAPPTTMAPVPLSLGETIESTSCKHVESGVNLRKLGKQFAKGSPRECHSCPYLRPRRLKGKPKVVGKKALWICLACGQIECGPDASEAKHKDGGQIVIASHATAHSNTWLHPVVMQWGESLDCWCLLCNAQLDYGGVSGGDSGVSVVEKSSKVAMQPELLKRAAALLQKSLLSQSSTSKASNVDTEQATEVVSPEGKPKVDPGVVSLRLLEVESLILEAKSLKLKAESDILKLESLKYRILKVESLKRDSVPFSSPDSAEDSEEEAGLDDDDSEDRASEDDDSEDDNLGDDYSDDDDSDDDRIIGDPVAIQSCGSCASSGELSDCLCWVILATKYRPRLNSSPCRPSCKRHMPA